MKKIILLLCVLVQISVSGVEPLQEVSAYWNGKCFYEAAGRKLLKKRARVIEGTAIYFSANSMTCYGHALLDGVFPLYCMLKEHDLMNSPITLLIKVDINMVRNKTFLNIIQLLKDIFAFKEIVILKKGIFCEKLVLNEYVPYQGVPAKYFSFYGTFPESFQYINYLKNVGFCDNFVFRDTKNQNRLTEFVDYIKKSYKIDAPVIKNRMLVAHRSFARKIVNLDSLISSLRSYGYDVMLVDFENLSIKQQIIETSQSEFLLGTYGSNLVNAVFLHPEASVVILWHKYAKYFWSRRYCIIHSAFLAAGVKLIEYDQPQYHPRNVYSEKIHVPDYFYRSKNINVLRQDKVDMDAIIRYPLPAMYELTNVDLFIDPIDLVDCLRRADSF